MGSQEVFEVMAFVFIRACSCGISRVDTVVFCALKLRVALEVEFLILIVILCVIISNNNNE